MYELMKWKVSNANEATHLLLTGGKLKIGENNFEEFIKVYTKLMHENKDVSLVERVSDKIKLFIDLDSKQNADLGNLVNDILTILPLKYIKYICNKTNGIHLIFPDIITSPNEAKNMVLQLQEKLIKVYNYNKLFIKKVIDTSVYSTGLRMIGSYKKNEKRCYLKQNTLRTHLTKHDIEESLIRVSFSNKIYLNQNIDKHQQSYAISSSNVYKCIENEIQLLNENYKGIKIRNVKKIGNNFSISTDSKFCINLNSTHKSHFVYFVVNEKKIISQKCFCRCDTTENRLHGLCSKYKSKGNPLSHKAYNILLQLC